MHTLKLASGEFPKCQTDLTYNKNHHPVCNGHQVFLKFNVLQVGSRAVIRTNGERSCLYDVASSCFAWLFMVF